jgi:hypothetical protein
LLLLGADDDDTDVATDICTRGELTAVGLEAPRAASCIVLAVVNVFVVLLAMMNSACTACVCARILTVLRQCYDIVAVFVGRGSRALELTQQLLNS